MAGRFVTFTSESSVEISTGIANVSHRGEPGTFSVMTPVGKMTDFGTKFGVSVGNGTSDSLVMAEVFEGEVRFENKSVGESHFYEGERMFMVGNSEKMMLKTEGHHFKLQPRFKIENDQGSENQEQLTNLALGKPVSASGFWGHLQNGEVFSPSNINDGREDDTGSPGNWSFWLLLNEQTGFDVIDLQKSERINRIDLQNTKNRWHSDRGTKDFRIEYSIDGESYEPLFQGTLKKISAQSSSNFDFESFKFGTLSARYIKIYIDSYYSSTNDKSAGGGLNEVQIFCE